MSKDLFDFQSVLGDAEDNQWKEEWQGMPEFVQEDLSPHLTILVHFEKEDDVEAFSKLIDQKITFRTKSIWFPKADLDIVKNIRYSDESENIDLCF